MAISKITNKSITDATITAADMASGAVEGAMTTQIGGRRNLIINGAMQVAQRGTSWTGLTTIGYRLDRFEFYLGSFGTWTATQSTDVPTGSGFANSFKIECTTANASLASGNVGIIRQPIEGQNLQQLAKGTASAKNITVSFWVKSNKTGTYIFELYDGDNTRQVSASYSVSSSNTWEKKEITIDGDTTGAFDNDNVASLYVQWWLGAGSSFTSGTLNTSWASNVDANRVVGQVNLADTVGNTFQITGVQLEVGSVATPFEHRSFGEELALCQRYYEVIGNGADDTFASIGSAFYYTSSSMLFPLRFAVTKRTKTYTLDATSGATYYSGYRAGGMDDFNSFSITRRRPQCCTLYNDTEISGTQGDGFEITLNSGSAFVAIDDEL